MRYILLHFTYHQSPIPRMQIICLIAVVAIAVFIAVFKILMYSDKIATETYSESSDKQSLFIYLFYFFFFYSIFFFFCLIIQVKITTFRHIHFYLLFDVSSVTTLIVKKCYKLIFFYKS